MTSFSTSLLVVVIIEIVIKFPESRRAIISAHTNVIEITIPKNGGHLERRAAIGRRNTKTKSIVVVTV